MEDVRLRSTLIETLTKLKNEYWNWCREMKILQDGEKGLIPMSLQDMQARRRLIVEYEDTLKPMMLGLSREWNKRLLGDVQVDDLNKMDTALKAHQPAELSEPDPMRPLLSSI